MRIYDLTATGVPIDGAGGVQVSCRTDQVGAYWVLQWRALSSDLLQQKALETNDGYLVTMSLAHDELALVLREGLSVEDVTFEVRLFALYGASLETTDWVSVHTTLAESTSSGTPADYGVYSPPMTAEGDGFAEVLPSWMAMSGGLLSFSATAVNTSDGAILQCTTLPTGLAANALVYLKGEDPHKPYTVTAAPILPQRTVTISTDSIALETENLPYGVIVTTLCQDVSDPAVYYAITGLTVDGGTTTISLDHDISSTGTTWRFYPQTVLLSTTVPSEIADGNARIWCGSSVGRQVIEAIARPFAQYEQLVATHKYPWAVAQLNANIPWFGHIVVSPIDNTLPEDVIESVSESFLMPLTEARSLYDLLFLPQPTYYRIGQALLFHNYQLVQEDALPVSVAQDGTATVALSHPVLTSLPVYWYDDTYGWQTFNDAVVSGDGSTLRLAASPTGRTISLRYSCASGLDDAYASTFPTRINGAEYIPHVHQLWNAFDEMGLLLSVKRQWRDGSYESNADYRVRLLAASDVPYVPCKNTIEHWLALNFGSITRHVWDGQTDLVLPVGTEAVMVVGADEALPTTEVLLRDTSGPQRYYFRERPVDCAAAFTLQDTPTTYALMMQQDSTDTPASGDSGAVYIVLSDRDWALNADPVATYRYTQWAFDVTTRALSACATLRRGEYIVYARSGLTTTMFDNPDYRATLLDAEGMPNAAYRQHAADLLALSPMIVGTLQWGQSAWLSREEPTPYLTYLPTRWT